MLRVCHHNKKNREKMQWGRSHFLSVPASHLFSTHLLSHHGLWSLKRGGKPGFHQWTLLGGVSGQSDHHLGLWTQIWGHNIKTHTQNQQIWSQIDLTVYQNVNGEDILSIGAVDEFTNRKKDTLNSIKMKIRIQWTQKRQRRKGNYSREK